MKWVTGNSMGMALIAALIILVTPGVLADISCIAVTQEKQSAITPERALELLKRGNERFVSGD